MKNVEKEQLSEQQTVEKIVDLLLELEEHKLMHFARRKTLLKVSPRRFTSRIMLDKPKIPDIIHTFRREKKDKRSFLLQKVERTLFNIQNHQDLTENINKLEAKLQNQKTFLNMVVHDLRNPVESIMHGLEIVKNIISTNFG
jgi:signal transduction histidine kinase